MDEDDCAFLLALGGDVDVGWKCTLVTSIVWYPGVSYEPHCLPLTWVTTFLALASAGVSFSGIVLSSAPLSAIFSFKTD